MAKTSKPAKPRMATSETKLVRELANILNDTELAEIEIKKGDLKIRVSKSGPSAPIQYAAPPAAAAPVAPAPAPAPASATVSETAPTAKDHPGTIKSPMVGTAYLRANPESDPFTAVGSTVNEGDTLLLVEAMKTFNPIKAVKSGTVREILVDDAQAVEFGEPLMIIE